MDAIQKSLEGYSVIVRSNPVLTRKEEGKLVKVLYAYKTGKKRQAAREKLFNSNLRLVLKSAYHYGARCRISVVDLISAGIEGLGIAIDRFNPRKFKTKFSTYAVPWIDVKIMKLLSDLESSVYIPRHIMHKSQQHKRIMREFENDPLTDKETMHKLDVSKKVLGNIKAAKCYSVSLDEGYGEDNEMTLRNMIPDVRTVSSDHILIQQERREIINLSLSQLTSLQRNIIKARYLDDEKSDLQDLGKKYKLSGERIRQIEYKALRLLRRRFKHRTF